MTSRRDGDGQPDEQAEDLDPVEDRHRLLLAEAGVQELQPDLAQLGLVRRAERLAQLVRRRRDLRLEHLLPAGHARLDGVPAGGPGPAAAAADPRPVAAGPRSSPSATHVPSVIATKTASGISMSWDSITAGHTLIATIFLIDQAPTTWSTAVIVSILTPSGVVKSTLI